MAVVLLAVYAVAGFWGVPALLQWQVPRLAAAWLERPASVGEVRFNPFTLRLQVRQLQLAEADGRPLAAVGELVADLDWRSLWHRAWTLRQLHVDAPQVRLAVAPDGRFNVADLVATLRRHRPPSGVDGAGLPRVVVEDLALTRGRLAWDDQRAGYRDELAPIDLRFSRFSTLPDESQSYTLTAEAGGGGRLRWRGEASLAPLQGRGEVTIEGLPLRSLGAYLQRQVGATFEDGRLSATLPYRFAQDQGRWALRLEGARAAVEALALAPAGSRKRIASLSHLALEGVAADLLRREGTIARVRLADGRLDLRRDANGSVDVAALLAPRGPAAAPAGQAAAPAQPWTLEVQRIELERLAVHALDESAQPPVALAVGRLDAAAALAASGGAGPTVWRLARGALQADGIAVSQEGRPPLTLARAAASGVSVDMRERRASLDRVALEGGRWRVLRDAQGRLDLQSLLARAAGTTPETAPRQPISVDPAAIKPWSLRAGEVAVGGAAVDVEDQVSGLRAQVQDLALRLEDVGTDPARPIRFEASLRLREGGELALRGTGTPGTRALQADLQLRQLALPVAQPLLARHLRLKLVAGTLGAQGRIEAALPVGKPPVLRYAGSMAVDGLRLDEMDGRADDARAATGEAFAVQVRRLRLQDARLDFQDRSLRPQFGARIFALNGVVTGVSSARDARSRLELDGRVDDAGLARIRGALNPFSPRDSTDVNVVFRNVDLVPASPYAMKFAGYRIAEGRISLDLRYRLRDSRLEGDNHVVIERLTLGERVESPDALQLPLELAIAVLKDARGRIDLGVPVSGDLNDPQFNYGAVLWKAIGNVLARVVASPLRALGNLLGVGGEQLDAIAFDAGSARLLPPEREKLRQVAGLLGRREALRLSVPGRYDEAADGAALRSSALRGEIVRRAGLRLEPGESPGPLDVHDGAVRAALRGLFTERFGEPALDQARRAAENRRPAGEASGAAGAPVPVWRRIRNHVQGEPQVADAVGFYRDLQRRLEQAQPLAQDALPALAAQRAQAIASALRQDGVAGERVAVAPPEGAAAPAGDTGGPAARRSVAVTLQLATAR
jgi:uncharacterized protein involved in outer membrane biogenesis